MTPTEIARKHMAAARAETAAAGLGDDATVRAMLGEVVKAFLERRSVADVQAELVAAAENADPDTDYAFMRP